MELGLAALTDPLLLARRQYHRSILASSYDRRGGNHDWSNYIRREGPAAVMMEASGPGCITRIWTADPQRGTIRIFLDGNPAPVIECPFEELFARLPLTHGIGGESPERYARAAADHLPMGYTTYCPIPFRHGCKVTMEPEDDYLYYHIGANLYPPGEAVESFDPSRQPSSGVIADAEHRLANWTLGKPLIEMSEVPRVDISIAPGQSASVFEHDGPGVVRGLRLSLPDLDPVRLNHLRESLWLVAWFDDDERRDPSIHAPVGPFFLDYGQTLVPNSVFCGRDAAGEYYCYFAMPHRERVRIELVNRSVVDARVMAMVKHDPLASYDPELLRFRATWHVETPFGPDHRDYEGLACRLLNLDGLNNVELLNVDGAGHFVGCSFDADFSDAPTDRAACEGDEMFFIDDDPRLTMYGTGLEDYLNDAWGMRGYVGPLSGDALTGEWGVGPRLTGYRLHIPDPVPFSRRGRFTLEHGTGNNCSGLYRSVAYWYTDPARARTRVEEGRWEALRTGNRKLNEPE